MSNILSQKQIYFYGVLILLSLVFTIGDIVASSTQQMFATLILSSITLIISFVGRYKTKALQLSSGVDHTIDFIRSNFNKSSIILGVLDVICCIVALFTAVFWVALFSRCAIALRIFIYINKYKTVAISIWVIVYWYLIKRRCKKNMAFIKTFFKWIFANKKSICGTISGIVSGIATAIATNADAISGFSAVFVGGFNITPIIAGILVFAGVEIGVFGKGWEAIVQYTKRKQEENDAKAKIKEEQDKIKSEMALAKANESAEKKKAQDLKAALALRALKDKEEADRIAKAEHEAYLLKLAEEELAKASAEKTNNNAEGTVTENAEKTANEQKAPLA